MLETERREMRCTTLLPPGIFRYDHIDHINDGGDSFNDGGDNEGDNIDNDEDFVTDNTR